MRFFRPLAYFATLSLVVSLAHFATTAAIRRAETGEAAGARVEAYRANLLTQYEERIVGQRLAYLYEQRHTLLQDVETQTRLNRILTRLSRVLYARALEVRIIGGSRPEAVSFPPGRIYITSALIKLAPTDEALAAVIAHEAAHLEDHHLARLIALALALPPVEQGRFPTRRAIITGQALQFAFPSALDEARLHCEMEADEIAVQKLERAGYTAEALAILLDTLNSRLSPRATQERAAMRARLNWLRERPLLSLR
jgi:predicted Zn-dependent protease